MPPRALVAAVCAVLAAAPARARVFLQYFETPWREIEARLPEIAAAGYEALWLPPPTKGAEGAVDVGYSVYDRFDLGDQDARGTVATRYGTRAELVALVAAAHRHGLRVVFDVVMNHNANPSLIENAGVTLPAVALDRFPDVSPLDFHVLPARDLGDGSYQVRWPDPLGGGTRTLAPGSPENPEPFVAAVPIPEGVSLPGWDALVRAPRMIFDADLGVFELQAFSLLGLADFALEDGEVNLTAGAPLPVYVRQPDCPSCYPDGVPVAEDVRAYLMRWIAWLGATTGADGYRLDAIRHAPESFFSDDGPGDPISFHRAVQDEYDARHGFTDADDHDLIDDAQLFGESFTGDVHGELARYRATGMQLLNFPLFFQLAAIFSSGAGGHADLGQLSFPQGGPGGAYHEFGGLGRLDGVSFVQSHDSLPPDLQPDAAYAFVLTRPGDGVVFFDGNNPDPLSFVQPGRPDALGELGDTIVRLLAVHNDLAHGDLYNRFVDDDVYVYERATARGATLLCALTDNVGPDPRVAPDGAARLGGFDPRPLVVTAFSPGTELVDHLGRSPVARTAVLDPAALPPDQVARALAEYDRSSDFPPPPGHGLVHLAVPSGPDLGAACYSVATPGPPASGARPVELRQAGRRVPDVAVQTTGTHLTAAGRVLPPRVLLLPRVTAPAIEVHLRTDGLAASAELRLDDGPWQPLERGADHDNGDRGFALPLSLAALDDGSHVLRVVARLDRGEREPLGRTFTVPFVLDRAFAEPAPPAGPDGCAGADFDGDGVPDACDLCPDLAPAPAGPDGCRALSEDERSRWEAAVARVAAGEGDVGDLVRLADQLHGAAVAP